MRPSRRASAMAAQTLTTTLLPGPDCSHCSRHLLHDIAYIICASPLCPNLPLCIDCFVVGAYTIAPHRTQHPYRVVERLSNNIYTPDWTAQEEARLIHAVMEYGLDQWKRVAEYVRSKTQFKCEIHYNQLYLDSPQAPLPSDHALREQTDHHPLEDPPQTPSNANGHTSNNPNLPSTPLASAETSAPTEALASHTSQIPPTNPNAATPTPAKGKGKAKGKARGRPKGKAKGKSRGKGNPGSHNPDPATASTDSIQPPGTPAPGEASPSGGRSLLQRKGDSRANEKLPDGALQGYTWQREDFDIEFDDKAEELIADLAVAHDDDPEVLALKCRLLEIYDERLKVRESVKRIVFDRKLLDFKNLKTGDRRDTRDEKELAARLHVFKRILEPDKFCAFSESVMLEYRVAKDMYAYAKGREHGLRTKQEVEVYEIDARRRGAALGAKDKRQRIVDEKRNHARTKASVPLPANGDPATVLPNGSPAPLAVSDVKPVAPSMPLEGADRNPVLGCSENGSPVTAEPSMGVPAVVSLVANESKTAKLRRTREDKVLGRSPYPQVNAMRVDRKEGVSALTDTEKTLCSALRMLPMDFLAKRDAMLRVSEELFSQNERSVNGMSTGTDSRVLALRASVKSANGGGDGDSDKYQLDVTSAQMRPGRATSSRTRQSTAMDGQIISGSRHRVKLPRVDTNGAPAAMPPNVKVTPVQIEPIQEISEALQMQLTYCGAPEFDREEKREEIPPASSDVIDGDGQRSTKVKLILRPPKSEDEESCDNLLGGNIERRSNMTSLAKSETPDMNHRGIANMAVVQIAAAVPPTKQPYESEEILSSGSAQLSDVPKDVPRESMENEGKVIRRGRGRPSKKRRRAARRFTTRKNRSRRPAADANPRVRARGAENLGKDANQVGMGSGTARDGRFAEAVDLTTMEDVDGVVHVDVDSGPDHKGHAAGASAPGDGTGARRSPSVEVTEEILDGGNANFVSKRSLERLESSPDDAGSASGSADVELVPTTPHREGSVGSPRRSKSVRQTRTAPKPRLRTRRQKHSEASDDANDSVERADVSEGSSMPSTPSAEDSRDKDYEMDDTGEEPETPEEKTTVPRRSRQTLETPTRKSTRLSERFRVIEKSSPPALVTKSPAADTQGKDSVGAESENPSAAPEEPVKRKRGRPRKYPLVEGAAVNASGRKPPVTPRTGRKRGRPRREDRVDQPAAKMARLSSNAYSLRRRG